MPVEFEIKLSVEQKRLHLPAIPDPDSFFKLFNAEKILSVGNLTEPGSFERQTDTYYSHPCYDLKESDEVLRNRKTTHYLKKKKLWQIKESKNLITYKGPADRKQIKSRNEIEFPVDERIWEVFSKLQFKKALQIDKFRWGTTISWNHHKVNIVFDAVADLGTFIEIEVVSDKSNEAEIETIIMNLRAELGYQSFSIEERSYAALLQSL